MARTPRQHKLVIEAITGLAEGQFSGWEIQRRTGLPRMTVSRVMSRLHAMNLLAYLPGGQAAPWSVKGTDWARGPGYVCAAYEDFARSKSS